MAKTVTASNVADQLLKHLGEGGSYYWKKYGLAEGTPWCAAAVSASFADAGAKKYFYDGKPVFYVPYAQQWLKKNATHVKMADAKKGDVVIFTWSGNGYNKEQGSTRDHIGFIRKNSGSSAYVYTTEGNTNNSKVAKKTRTAPYIYAIYRTKLPKEETTTKIESLKSENVVSVNGKFDTKTKKYMQKWLGVTVDGIVGVKTTKALQKKVGAKTDGIWGKETTTKLQQYLTKKGFSTKASGKFDSKTIKSLQKFLNNFFFFLKTDKTSAAPQTTVKPPTTESDTAKQAVSLKKIVDISYWQGKVSVADFQKAKKDGVTGVILRSSFTSQDSFTLNKDSVFDNNIKNAISAGLPVGVYHYSQAISVAEAQKEAKYVLKIIKGMKLQLPVVFDWEFGGRLSASVAKKNGITKNTDICSGFCNIIKDAGFTPMVYANLSTLNNYLSANLHKKWKIWVAQYSDTCGYKHPRYLWQYTSTGKVAGLSGNIDISKG